MDIKELERQIRDVYSTLMYGLLKLNKRINNIEPGSGNVNTVNGKTGDVVLDASDVGAIPSTDKGANGGVATLGNDGKVPISQLPSISGGNVRMSMLWENPSPTSSFAAQDITLSSADYDMLLITYVYGVGGSRQYFDSTIAPKGENINLDFATASSGSASCLYRFINYSSDTSLSVQNGYLNTSLDNNRCIPMQIYGIKLL